MTSLGDDGLEDDGVLFGGISPAGRGSARPELRQSRFIMAELISVAWPVERATAALCRRLVITVSLGGRCCCCHYCGFTRSLSTASLPLTGA